VKVVGNYHDMGAFASDVGHAVANRHVDDVSIQAGKDGILTMDAVARTRTCTHEEVAARSASAGGQERR